MGAGRFACVALPLVLTVASIIALLIAMLGGVTDKNLGLFEINTKDLSISSSSLENLVDTVTRRSPELHTRIDLDDLNLNGVDLSSLNLDSLNLDNLSVDEIAAKVKDSGIANADEIAKKIKEGGKDTVTDLLNSAKNGASDAGKAAIAGTNITAKNLNLADYYRVSLWGYCSWTDGKRTCTKAKFDWASSQLNETAYKQIASTTGTTVTLPKDVRGALKTFGYVSKWTQVVYIIAIIAAAVELVFGLFAICSRIGSCCTFIVSSIATTAIIAASILATVQASVVVGAVKATGKAYGVKGSISTKYLVITWLAAAFSIGAGLFWLFTICCCASDSKSKNKGYRGSRHSDTEKLIPGGARGYQRVGDHNTGYVGHQSGVPLHNVTPSRASAYEPYSHTRV